MNDAHRFRGLLRNRLFHIVALSALAEGAIACGPIKGQRDECFDPNGTDGGVMATGGGGGASGAGGTGGDAGSANAITCPAPEEAMNRFELGDYCKVLSIDGPPSVKNGECCYPVTEQCPSAGRPFVVEGRAITAAGAETDGWRTPLTPRIDTLSADAREALAETWLRDALAEHASIASFACASLELMALGAPASLVEATHRAALEEARHAQLCFAMASAYAGRELGPGTFDFGGAVAIASDLATFAARVVVEGCVGETLAAIDAAERLVRETDPTVQRVLSEIAEDEARHAELAWRTVAWALRTGGPEVRAAIEAAFDDANTTDDVVLPAMRLLLGNRPLTRAAAGSSRSSW